MAPSDYSIQGFIDPWWVESTSKEIVPGALVWAFVPFVDQVPYTFKGIGRKEPRKHQEALVKIERLEIKKSYSTNPPLPVAAMSLDKGEVWSAFRAKKRPCLILAISSNSLVNPKLAKNLPKRSYAKTVIVAPYYGADQKGRVGYPPSFMERIRHAEYPQFFADKLPMDGKTKESVLRFDHIQPVGFSENSFELTGYKLSDPAKEVIDDWLHWRLWGGLPIVYDPVTKEKEERALETFWDFMDE